MIAMAWMGRVALGLVVIGGAVVPGVAHALSSDCASENGSCTVSNDMGDTITCACTDGTGIGGGGGNEWDGLSQAELDGVCKEQLDMLCGPPVPPVGVSCEAELGSCLVTADPPSYTCDCAGGFGAGGAGDESWSGLTDDELYDICLQEVDDVCGAVATDGGTSVGTSDSAGTSDSGGTTGNATTSATGDDGSGGDAGTTAAEGGGSTGAGTTGAGSSGGDATGGGSSGGAGETTAAGSDGDSSTGGGAADDGGGGCSCDVDREGDASLLAIGLVGLVALRRRRR